MVNVSASVLGASAAALTGTVLGLGGPAVMRPSFAFRHLVAGAAGIDLVRDEIGLVAGGRGRHQEFQPARGRDELIVGDRRRMLPHALVVGDRRAVAGDNRDRHRLAGIVDHGEVQESIGRGVGHAPELDRALGDLVMGEIGVLDPPVDDLGAVDRDAVDPGIVGAGQLIVGIDRLARMLVLGMGRLRGRAR